MYNLEFIRLYSSCCRVVSECYPSRALDCGAYLSRSIDDLGQEGLPFVDNLMAEGVFNGRVVALDKMAFAVLDGEGRFACKSKKSA